MCAVLGDDQRPRFREIKHLPGHMIRRHGRSQRFAAPGANLWVMVDGGIGLFNPAQRLARMAVLPAGLLARWFPQAADPQRLLQPVAGRWLAAVAAVQPEAALQFRQPPDQRRILGAKHRILRLQCRHGRFNANRGRYVVSGACVIGRCHDTLTRTQP